MDVTLSPFYRGFFMSNEKALEYNQYDYNQASYRNYPVYRH